MNDSTLPKLRAVVNNADLLNKDRGQIEADMRALSEAVGLVVRADGKIRVIKEGGNTIDLSGSNLVEVPFEELRSKIREIYQQKLDEKEEAFEKLEVPTDD